MKIYGGLVKVYLAIWDHSSGIDQTAHKTEEGAFKQLETWAKMYRFIGDNDWTSHDEKVKDKTDREIVLDWADITGGNEHMDVKEFLLND